MSMITIDYGLLINNVKTLFEISDPHLSFCTNDHTKKNCGRVLQTSCLRGLCMAPKQGGRSSREIGNVGNLPKSLKMRKNLYCVSFWQKVGNPKQSLIFFFKNVLTPCKHFHLS